ncbi:MAG: hypothetical protein IKS17_08575 [Firmicutes bacterium]|nr:hypothetical protein [Bacillota bacterium]
MDTQDKCPVCGKYTFEDEYDICPVCGWENDPLQAADHNYPGGANALCVNEARIEYFLLSGKSTAEKAAHIRQNYKSKMELAAQKYMDVAWSEEQGEEYERIRQKYIDILNKLLNG